MVGLPWYLFCSNYLSMNSVLDSLQSFWSEPGSHWEEWTSKSLESDWLLLICFSRVNNPDCQTLNSANMQTNQFLLFRCQNNFVYLWSSEDNSSDSFQFHFGTENNLSSLAWLVFLIVLWGRKTGAAGKGLISPLVRSVANSLLKETVVTTDLSIDPCEFGTNRMRMGAGP